MTALGLRCCMQALVTVSGGYSNFRARASHSGGFSLWSVGSRAGASVFAAHGLSSCNQGLHLCPLHRQVDS